MAEQLVARLDPRPEEPPLVAPEDQMRVGDAADLRRRGTVAGVGGHGERLRRHDCRRSGWPAAQLLVVVQRVGVVHGLHPTPDVVDGDGLLELPGMHRHAHVTVEIGSVQTTVDSSLIVFALAGQASRVITSGRVRRRALWCRCEVMGISPGVKNKHVSRHLVRGHPFAQERPKRISGGGVGALGQFHAQHDDLPEPLVGQTQHPGQPYGWQARRLLPSPPARRWRRRS